MQKISFHIKIDSFIGNALTQSIYNNKNYKCEISCK